MNLPTGCARVSPSRYRSIRSFSASGPTPSVNDSSPTPISPVSVCPSGLTVACQIGGWGCWNGFGETRRRGIRQNSPSSSISSSVHARTIDVERLGRHRTGLLGIDAEPAELFPRPRPPDPELQPPVAQEVDGGGLLGDADRVVVRVGDEPDAVADPHAPGDRGDVPVDDFGRRAQARVLDEVVLDRPEAVPSELVGQAGLLDGLLQEQVLLPVEPGLGRGNLVEESELHAPLLPGERPAAASRPPG